MTTSTKAIGSAERWGPLWSARPQDWAGNEDQQMPTYDEAIRRAGIAAGQRVLDVGCGSGVFLRAAADRRAYAYGLDASAALLEIARRRVPDADLRVGDMQLLPYEDDLFDAVTGFNSFFFAADMTAALREARRVAKPGAPVVIQVWGRPEHCDLAVMKRAVARFIPEPEAPPPAFWAPGVLEALATEAGLEPETAFDVSWAYEYADEQALTRGMLSAGGIAQAGEQAATAAILEALAPQRSAGGAYRLTNEWHYLIARA